jgi:hypothetical protein
MADKNKSVEEPKEKVDRRFESTVRNLLDTPPDPKRERLKKEGGFAAPKSGMKKGLDSNQKKSGRN